MPKVDLTQTITLKTILLCVVCLAIGATAGWLGRPERIKTEWKTEYKDRIEWKEKVVETVKTVYQQQSITKLDIDTDCEEKFDANTGRLTYRHCKRSVTKDNTTNQAGSTNANTNTQIAGKETVTGKEGGKTDKGDIEKGRVAVMVGSKAELPLSPKLGFSADYRLFWRVWGGAYIFPTDKAGGLQLSFTF